MPMTKDNSKPFSYDERAFRLQIEHPGGTHAHYTLNGNGMELKEVTYPHARYPGDLCRVLDTLESGQRPLGALLLGNLSHPTGCLVWARPLGLVEIEAPAAHARYVLAVAADDPYFDEADTLDHLPTARLDTIRLFFQIDRQLPPEAIRWASLENALAAIRTARHQYRLAQTETGNPPALEPAWKPARGPQTTGERESERHTRAEYTFYSLPYRFQQYVEEYLAPDERILRALARPAMRSALKRTWLTRKRLEEGVVILSSQQITEVVEILPPDRAGIFYGFIARCGVPERVEAVDIVQLPREGVGLKLTLAASGGREELLWEFPGDQASGVRAIREQLTGWLPGNPSQDKRLRRATPPQPPGTHPPMKDPAANHPEETRIQAERLQTARQTTLPPCEAVLAHALLPAWVEGRGAASLLTITPQRILVTPDPDDPSAARLALDIPLHAISSLEFCSTLMVAYLKLFIPHNGQITGQKIPFGKTLAAVEQCYRVLRQAMAIVPLHAQAMPGPLKPPLQGATLVQ